MSVANMPTSAFYQRGSMVTLGVGVCLSLVVHLGIGVGASEYFASTAIAQDLDERTIAIEPEAVERVMPRDELRLGMDESKVASINWLGVVENPEVGDVSEAEVEQAEFTKQVGESAVTTSPQPAAVSVPVDEVAQEQLVEEAVQEEQVEVAEADPVESGLTEQIELDVESKESETVVDVQPEPVEKPIEEVVEEKVVGEDVAEPEMFVGPESVSVEPKEPVETKPIEKKPEQEAESSEEAAPTTAGKDGEISEKESAASKIKRAIQVDGSKLHKPIVGKGIELTTVEPRFPASIRFRELPRNPVLIIRFDGNGRVSLVSFLTEGKRVYDTGVKGVDEPLVNAVYQWRAKGKEIDALDPKNPESYIEIPMRITFRKERKLP